jgi:catechol 2,3-dioxygenase-like lactoylglutathione lyase family enzyme
MKSLSISCIRLTLLILQPLYLTGWVLSHKWSLKNSFGRCLQPQFLQRPDGSITQENNDEKPPPSPPFYIHHTAIKTRNITTAIQFYFLLGFSLSCKFRSGPARAAWLELHPSNSTTLSNHNHNSCRLEIIEVPLYMLNEQEGTQKRAIDLMERQDFLGHNHLALDVTNQINDDCNETQRSLQAWMDVLNERSVKAFGKKLRIALAPRQQLIGNDVYELAFVYDADGSLVELLHKQSELAQEIQSGWEPWDGKGFIGAIK